MEEEKVEQSWKDVIDVIGIYMRNSGIDVDNEPVYSRLYEYIGDEIMNKAKRSWRADELLSKIKDR